MPHGAGERGQTQSKQGQVEKSSWSSFGPKDVLCPTERFLGHGCIPRRNCEAKTRQDKTRGIINIRGKPKAKWRLKEDIWLDLLWKRVAGVKHEEVANSKQEVPWPRYARLKHDL